MKKYFNKNFSFILLATLLLPLFYINVKDSHDWGDDFAQYFIQARNILEHRPQTDNGLVFDSQTGEYALQAYPVGFPLILASAWKCFGDSILVSSLTISFFFFAFGLVAFFYFRKYFNDAISVLLTIVIIYNPLTIGFKKEILSDIPFSFFMLLGVLLFQSERKNTMHNLLTGAVWAFALSVRGIGATLFFAAGFFFLLSGLRNLRKKEDRGRLILSLRKIIAVFLSAITFYLLLNSFLFPVPSTGILKFYGNAVSGEDFGKWMLLNLDYYYDVFLNFFASMGGGFQWLSTLTKFILLALIPIGMIVLWYRGSRFDDLLFIVYLIVLFVYPYLGGGFRFLLPVMPFIMKYIFIAFSTLMKRLRIKSPVPGIIFLVLIILQYTPGIIDQVQSMDIPEEGPVQPSATEAFEYIRHLPEDAVVVFLKPRALSFYSGKKAAYVTRIVNPDEIRESFRRMNAHYFLLCSQNEEVNDLMLKKYIKDYENELKLIWQNSYFELYSDMN